LEVNEQNGAAEQMEEFLRQEEEEEDKESLQMPSIVDSE